MHLEDFDENLESKVMICCLCGGEFKVGQDAVQIITGKVVELEISDPVISKIAEIETPELVIGVGKAYDYHLSCFRLKGALHANIL